MVEALAILGKQMVCFKKCTGNLEAAAAQPEFKKKKPGRGGHSGKSEQ